MRHLKSTLAVIGAAVILVLAGNTIAIAANGKGFLLGKANTATKMTTLKRTTAGSTLKVQTKSSASAPLVVNGHGKVANLNADKVDGLDSAALQTTSYTWTKAVTVATTNVDLNLALAPGNYVLGYAAYLAGAGVDGSTGGCFFYRNRAGTYTYWAETRQLTGVSFTPGFTGTTLLNVAAGDVVRLYCSTPSDFTTIASEPIQIYATRTDVAGGGTLRTAPSSGRLAH